MYNHELMAEAQDNLSLTNRDIANQTNLSESTVSRYMAGQIKEASADVLADLCSVLHISLDIVMGRDAVAELPIVAGPNMTEDLRILRDFTSRNFERVRVIEREKDAVFNSHINHLKEQLDRYSTQYRKYNVAIFSLIALCALLLGIIIVMLVNNRALNSELSELENLIALYSENIGDPVNYNFLSD